MLAGPTVLLVNDGRDVARPAAVGTADPSLRTRRPVAPAPAPGDRPHVHYRVDAGRTNCLDANMPCEDERCYDGAFPFCEKSAGVVVASGGRIVGIDLFAGPDTLRSVWGPLAGSYFRRAVPDAAPTGVASPADVRAFIDRVAGAARPIKKFGTIGCELEILGDDLAGHALLFAGQVCHISAFVRPGEA
jgi:hypothetical protein